MKSHRLEFVVCLVLILTTLLVYGQVRNHGFLNFDDNVYVSENPQVRAGLTKKGVIWAFTTFHTANWHPLTWLSHMIDTQLFGLNAGLHHLTNLLFHIANTILLFFFLRWVTGSLWGSAFVAALFALHPLHVESVPWVAERKDLLSTFFWLLSMLAYVHYARRPSARRYGIVLLFFTFGLLAKPMLVTLPFVLLLLDYWPLGRLQMGQTIRSAHLKVQKSSVSGLVREKIPLFALVTVSCYVTFFAQQHGGAVKSFGALPLDIRIANALVSYMRYIGKMIWPHELAVYYPYFGIQPAWHVVGAGLFLVGLSVLLISTVRRYPYLAVGWLWYLGTLVPVIGLIQVGGQSMADRYTYIPLIGLFILIAWGGAGLLERWLSRRVLALSAGVVLLGILTCSWLQVRHWKDSITLFTHAIGVTVNNALAHNSLGSALAWEGRLEEAESHYREALRIMPNQAIAHYNLGVTLATKGRYEEAIAHYKEALRIKPDYADAHNNLGVALKSQWKFEEAESQFYEALRIEPDYALAHYNLGIVLVSQGRYEEAIGHYLEALWIDPDDAKAHYNLGNALMHQGRLEEAITHFSEALRINPDSAKMQYRLGVALVRMGKYDEAISHYQEALRIEPDHAKAHYNLANAWARQQRLEEAMSHYADALRINPDYADAHINLGNALASQGRLEEATNHFSEAIRINPDDADAHYNLGTALVSQGKLKEAISQFSEVLRIKPDDADARRTLERALQRLE
jgi:tetratricopeptide (TPR) repeat protein